MARTYAGILALVGMLVVLLRALKEGAGIDGTVMQALAVMFLMAAVGFMVGAIASFTIEESVRSRLQAELDASQTNEQQQPAT